MREKKPKRRFMTANQIRDEIDKFKQKAIKHIQTAEGLELAANELAKYHTTYEDAVFKREEAKKSRRAAQRIYDVKLPKLKQKLAEWSTELLPGVITDGDRSIQV